MATKMAKSDIRQLRITHFQSLNGKESYWMFVYPVLSLMPGPQQMVDGSIDHHNPGGCLWSGTTHYPQHFQTRDEAIRFAFQNDVPVVDVDDDFDDDHNCPDCGCPDCDRDCDL